MPGSGTSVWRLPRRLLRENLVLVLVGLLVPLPLLGPFLRDASGRNLSTALFQGLGILLLVLFLLRIELRGGLGRLGQVLQSGVNAPVAALMVWTAIGVARAPDRAFATGELLRLTSGAAVYFALALHLERRDQLALLLDYLVAMLVLLIGHALVFPSSAGDQTSALFPSKHHFSAVLTVLFPLVTSLAFDLNELRRALTALAAAILCVVGLLISMERSAWIAAVVGLIVWQRMQPSRSAVVRARGSWRSAAVVVAAFLLTAVLFLWVTGVGAAVADRARVFSAAMRGKDESFAWRVAKWRGALAMVIDRPVTGWGPGQFALFQSRYTGLGMPREDVRRYGPSFDEMAYNEYLQTAAELGIPGLGLFLLMLGSFFAKARKALRRLSDGLRRTVLRGCVAGIAAFMVDAFGNGSWRYIECTVFFWLVLGLGVATIRLTYRGAPSARSGLGAKERGVEDGTGEAVSSRSHSEPRA